MYVLYPGVITTAKGGASLGTGGGVIPGGVISQGFCQSHAVNLRNKNPRSLNEPVFMELFAVAEGTFFMKSPVVKRVNVGLIKMP